jgi:regulator of sigma E protease
MQLLSTFLYNAGAFIVILSVIVFVHEFGHYIVAKLSGVKIEVFSIGFGKELLGWNDKSGTRWKISLLPLGGYVKMFGDTNPASMPDTDKIKAFTAEEEKIAFHTKPLYKKAAIVAAGPIANFILAIFILTFMFWHDGKPTSLPIINVVMEGSAAAEAGLQSGDVIISMDGESVSSFNDIQRIVSLNTGTPITTIIQRSNEQIQLAVTPKIVSRKDIFGNTINAAFLGVSSSIVSYQRLKLLPALGEGISETYNISAGTLKAIGQMITGQRSVKEISGPIGIAKYSGQSVEKGLATVLWFMTVLSINLGLINLFPVPILDGGHLLYYAVEAIRGKPLADKVQQLGFKLGMLFILALAALGFINDFRNLN